MFSLSIVDPIPLPAVLVNRDGTIGRANALAAELFGYSLDDMRGLPVEMLLPEELRGHHKGLVRAFFAHATGRRMQSGRELIACRQDGSTFPADISLSAESVDGDTVALVCLIDLSPYKARQAVLDRSSRALAFLSGSNRTLLRATDMTLLLDEICRLAVDFGGYRLAWVGHAEHGEHKLVRAIAQSGFAKGYLENVLITWADDEHGRGPAGVAIRTGEPVTCRFINTDPNYAPWRQEALKYGFQSSIALPLLVEGQVFGILSLHASVPDAFDEEELRLLMEVAGDLMFGIEMLRTRQARKQAEERLRQLVGTDFLTGLANRASLTEFLNAEFAQGRNGALLFIDLQRFKEINDTQGYLVGDALLKALALRLSATLPSGEILARIGGDEFVLVVPAADQAAAMRTAERLTAALAESFSVGGLNISLGAKIGIALYPGGRATPDEIYADAGLASRDAGATPGGSRVYSPQIGAAFAARLQIARGLESAMADGGLRLHYQPKVDMLSGRMTGAEALLRWHDSRHDPIGPDRFIPIAEERGLMPALGKWVIAESCRQLSAWKTAGLHFPGRLAINVSAMQFDAPGFVSTIAEMVAAAGRSPADFQLEITESVLAADGQAAIAMMEQLKDMGFVFAVDDFGTGFSSLAYLSRFPVETLKIDISFVRNMLKSRNDHVIVQTVIGMARSLGLATVAEGVETAEQARALVDLGCTVAQGFHYGRPESPDMFANIWLGEGGSVDG